MEILHLNTAEFEEKLKADGKILADFYADWCGPCSMMAPVLEEIASERDDITVIKINVDENADLAISYGINTIPAFLAFENGEKTAETIGYMSKEQLLERLELKI